MEKTTQTNVVSNFLSCNREKIKGGSSKSINVFRFLSLLETKIKIEKERNPFLFQNNFSEILLTEFSDLDSSYQDIISGFETQPVLIAYQLSIKYAELKLFFGFLTATTSFVGTKVIVCSDEQEAKILLFNDVETKYLRASASAGGLLNRFYSEQGLTLIHDSAIKSDLLG